MTTMACHCMYSCFHHTPLHSAGGVQPYDTVLRSSPTDNQHLSFAQMTCITPELHQESSASKRFTQQMMENKSQLSVKPHTERCTFYCKRTAPQPDMPYSSPPSTELPPCRLPFSREAPPRGRPDTGPSPPLGVGGTRRAPGLAVTTAQRRAARGGRPYRSAGCPRWRGSAARRRSGRGNLRTRPGWRPWPPTGTANRHPRPAPAASANAQLTRVTWPPWQRTAPAPRPRPSPPARGAGASLRDWVFPPKMAAGGRLLWASPLLVTPVVAARTFTSLIIP